MSKTDEAPAALPPSSHWAPEQAIAAAQGVGFTHVLIVGYDERGQLVLRSSRMTKERALYLLKQAEQHALGANNGN